MTKQYEPPCVSRRTVLLRAAGALPLIALGATAAHAGKLSQASVNYQKEPHEGKHCSLCNFYIAPSSCKQVDGTIYPTGYCTLFVAKG